MRKINILFITILLSAIVYLAMINKDNNITFDILKNGTDVHTQTFSLTIFILTLVFVGIVIGAGTIYVFMSVQGEKLKAYKRELEKSSVLGSNNASRVEVLEAKIETLEKAFNTVIDERTQLEVQIKSLNAELDKLNNK